MVPQSLTVLVTGWGRSKRELPTQGLYVLCKQAWPLETEAGFGSLEIDRAIFTLIVGICVFLSLTN